MSATITTVPAARPVELLVPAPRRSPESTPLGGAPADLPEFPYLGLRYAMERLAAVGLL